MIEISTDLQQTADSLNSKREIIKSKKFLIGFDGMIDEIIHVVGTRKNKDEYLRIPTIVEFSKRIASAQGKSSNLELVPLIRKIGGNAPSMSMAVSGMGADVCCMGIMGYPEIMPEFQVLAEHCEIISIADPGSTDALEFDDGKVMLGKLKTISEMSWKNICDRLGEEKFGELLKRSDFVACTNWTMLTEFDEILDQIIGKIPKESNTIFFFDIADPEKRKPVELQNLLNQLKVLDEKTPCVLGLNLREAEQILDLLGFSPEVSDTEEGIQLIAGEIRKKVGINGTVVHSVGFAGAEIGEQTAGITGPYTPKPKITTGAGDHFNGGFSCALAAGLPLAECLYSGVATSGWYVRNGGRSPRLNDVIGLLKTWSQGQLSD